METQARYSIGRLAKLTGLPVKTIRFYSDAGVLPERARTPAGYRLYDDEDRVRLELIRTLRDIGVDLTTIRSLGSRSLGEVLELQLKAVEAQLRSLQRTRAVLRATLDRGPDDSQLRRLHALGRLGAAEIELLLDEFIDDVGGGVPARHQWLLAMREAMVPELPEEPTVEQLDAWLELAELLGDADFRSSLRGMGRDYWEQGYEPDPELQQRVVREAYAAAAAGVEPGTPQAQEVLDRVLGLLGQSSEDMLRAFDEHDHRAERFWELVAIIREEPWPAEPTIAYRWIEAALRHRHKRVLDP
jgi:DNA-binding transcriptional MerR regulator